MKLNQLIFLFGFSPFLITSCGKKGCTDPSALNYDNEAKKYDGSCLYDQISDSIQPIDSISPINSNSNLTILFIIHQI